MQSFRVKKGQRIIFNPGLGAMGFGLPAAIGACIAGGKRTICINGDGGFQLNIQELETIKRLNLPIKFFIL
jgi:acetolactate synthase-1/2/3 large subunit